MKSYNCTGCGGSFSYTYEVGSKIFCQKCCNEQLSLGIKPTTNIVKSIVMSFKKCRLVAHHSQDH